MASTSRVISSRSESELGTGDLRFQLKRMDASVLTRVFEGCIHHPMLIEQRLARKRGRANANIVVIHRPRQVGDDHVRIRHLRAYERDYSVSINHHHSSLECNWRGTSPRNTPTNRVASRIVSVSAIGFWASKRAKPAEATIAADPSRMAGTPRAFKGPSSRRNVFVTRERSRKLNIGVALEER